MLSKIWRYSHFSLAVSSCVFVVLAAITGVILAFEPIEAQLQGFEIEDIEEISLAQLVDSLNSQYDEIIEVAVDANNFFRVSVISMEDSLNGDFYINPKNGKKIGDIPPPKPFYEFVTNLHRSLFLKTIGRIFIGVTSFFLFLIAITGGLLLIKRQQGIRNFFRKIIKEDFFQYYHVIFGRLMLIPIIIIALSGVYLSLLRFSFIPDKQPLLVNSFELDSEEQPVAFADFPVFKETKLRELRKLEFPFSTEIDDYFILSLSKHQVKINQKNGAIVEELSYPLINLVSRLSFQLHTGEGSIIWSVVLAIAAINILFFIYSGGLISYKRLRSKIKNSWTAEQAEIVILVGSENGSTQKIANILQAALLKNKQKVYLAELNAYQVYEKMTHLIIMTSTYGDGDPPLNANDFLELFAKITTSNPVQCSVVGFGSWAYPNFCQFAVDIHAALKQNPTCILPAKPFLIHNKSYHSFGIWAQSWSQELALNLELPPDVKAKKTKTGSFEVLDKQLVQDSFGDTFVLTLKSANKNYQSGDLLAVFPPNDPVERLYSIAKIKKDLILLSVKKHELGICSNYLYGLEPQSTLTGNIKKNKSFHFPRKGKTVTLIANGTGIAPFLGMIHHTRKNIELNLYWGGRTYQSYELYKSMIDEAINKGNLANCKTVFSREEGSSKYVQDLLQLDGEKIVTQLREGGSIMICGSTAMQNDVLTLLDSLSLAYNDCKLSHYQNMGQILMDCY